MDYSYSIVSTIGRVHEFVMHINFLVQERCTWILVYLSGDSNVSM